MIDKSQRVAAPYVRKTPRLSYVEPNDSWLRQKLIGAIEVMLGRRKIEAIYNDLKEPPFEASDFFHNALQSANIQTNVTNESLKAIPKKGPLLFIANHPFGIIDGLILCDLALKTRGNFQILLHSLLCQDEDLLPHFLPVDFNQSKQAAKVNILTKRSASKALEQDIPILIFPSGMVSTANRFGFGEVKDAPWSTFAAKLIRESKATVVPVFFHGRNSRKFHLASHIAEPLRMALMVNEALNKFNSVIDLTVGTPIPWSDISDIQDRKALTDYMYEQVQKTGLNAVR
ncbi:lysophospholipid acyltransferase family protein [Glaciecola petra]|uniref:Lysophospholipid acyltransferase family protein n=1 Tax=Glaciecola petra TaxID=3075602 RepID=A0ABU2ZR50_9ALTE|nr:lysophospholipid acyltransferase family protein [Aestuariibacter sp. P117]MDT0595110.1 lysophospholipid acyltransferase family protein [Aestuariibacter sp. P117]